MEEKWKRVKDKKGMDNRGMKFTKMQGCGNDYVYVNGFTENIPIAEKPELVRRLSDRHFGIGGDGVIFINPSEEADFEMEMYNADGSRSEMCGNGIRCVAKYVYDKGLTDKEELCISHHCIFLWKQRPQYKIEIPYFPKKYISKKNHSHSNFKYF